MKKRSMITVFILLLVIPFAFMQVQAKKSPAWLGIYTQTVDEDLIEAFELDTESGVIIKHVVPDSPADEANLRQGDIIISVNGEEVDDSDELIDLIRSERAGEDADIIVIRDGDEEKIIVTLGSLKDHDEPVISWFHKGKPHSYSKTWKYSHSSMADSYIGVTLESLGKQLGEYFGVEDGEGVLITEIFEDSPAEKAGLKAGDVIIEIDGEVADEVEIVKEAVGEKDEGETVELTVLRERKQKEFEIEVEEAPESYWGSRVFTIPHLDDFDIYVPPMKGLLKGDIDDAFFESEELEEEMKDLRREMEELKKEFKKLKE